MNKQLRFLLGLILVVPIIFMSCQPSENKPGLDKSEVSSSNYILNKDGEYWMAFDHAKATIYTQSNVFAIQSKATRTTFFDKQGEWAYEINFGESIITLRNKESILYYIELEPDKIEIGLDDSMVQTWELKRKNERIDIEFSNSNLTEIRWEDMDNNELVFDEFRIYGFSNSLAPGILAVSGVEDEAKAVLIAWLCMIESTTIKITDK